MYKVVVRREMRKAKATRKPRGTTHGSPLTSRFSLEIELGWHVDRVNSVENQQAIAP